MRKQIRSLDVLSTTKVGCLVGLLLSLVIGCFTVFLPMLVVPSMFAAMMPDAESAMGVAGGGFLMALISYIVFVLVYGVILGVSALLIALLYNLVAGMVGGVVVEMQDE